MTQDEFLSFINSAGGLVAPGADDKQITLASSGLQQMRAAMLPMFIINLYKKASGIVLGNAYIYGPNEITITQKFPVPGIVQINRDLSGMPGMHGITVFGRNDLFLFAFDAFGVCYMLDNTNLKPLRKYDDPYRAMNDCMVIGKL